MTPRDPIAALALRDCGPSGPGAPVRDHLPVYLSTDARAVCLARLAHGEALYGAPLAVGWERALLELAQELADAIAYAVAGGLPEGLTRDIVAAYEASLRLARTQPRHTKEPTMSEAPIDTPIDTTNPDAELFDRLAAAARDGSLVAYAIAVQTVDPGRETVTTTVDFVVAGGDDGNFDVFKTGCASLAGKVDAYFEQHTTTPEC